MRKRNSNFGRQTPTYICNCCDRRTRETGNGESDCDLCYECYELAGLDNSINDGGRDATPSELAWANELLGRIAKKGGDVEYARNSNSYIWK